MSDMLNMMILGIVVIVALIFIVISFVRRGPDQRQFEEIQTQKQTPKQETEKTRIKFEKQQEFKNYLNKASEGLTYTLSSSNDSTEKIKFENINTGAAFQDIDRFRFRIWPDNDPRNNKTVDIACARSVGFLYPISIPPFEDLKSHLMKNGVSEDILKKMHFYRKWRRRMDDKTAYYFFDLKEVLPIFYLEKQQLFMNFIQQDPLTKEQHTQEQQGLFTLKKYFLEEMMIFKENLDQWKKLRDKTDRDEKEQTMFHDLSLHLLEHVQEKLDPAPDSYFATLADELKQVIKTKPVEPVVQ
jgi:hypothetical protein